MDEHQERWLDEAAKWPAHKVTLKSVREVVRKTSRPPKQREPCFVCYRYKRITHAHHLVEVGKVAKVLHMMAIFDWSPKIPVVFLCPNHHALWHEMNRLGSAFLSEVMGEFEKHERDRLVELAEMRDRAKTEVWPSVRQKCEACSLLWSIHQKGFEARSVFYEPGD